MDVCFPSHYNTLYISCGSEQQSLLLPSVRVQNVFQCLFYLVTNFIHIFCHASCNQSCIPFKPAHLVLTHSLTHENRLKRLDLLASMNFTGMSKLHQQLSKIHQLGFGCLTCSSTRLLEKVLACTFEVVVEVEIEVEEKNDSLMKAK